MTPREDELGGRQVPLRWIEPPVPIKEQAAFPLPFLSPPSPRSASAGVGSREEGSVSSTQTPTDDGIFIFSQASCSFLDYGVAIAEKEGVLQIGDW